MQRCGGLGTAPVLPESRRAGEMDITVQSEDAAVPEEAGGGELAVRLRGDACRALVRVSDALGSRAD